MTTRYEAFAGVDVGSLGTKSVIFANGEIAGSSIIRTGIRSVENGLAALEKALDAENLKREDIRFTVGTGYGRVSAPYADKAITEITCHARGVHRLVPNTRTVIEIETEDRIGLLYAISQSFTEVALDISAAKICTEKGAAIDSFYVREHDGQKIVAAERQGVIEQKLRQAIRALEKAVV